MLIFRRKSSPPRKRIAAVTVAVGLRAGLRSRLYLRRTAREIFVGRKWKRSREKPLARQKLSSRALLLPLLLMLLPPMLLLLLPLLLPPMLILRA